MPTLKVRVHEALNAEGKDATCQTVAKIGVLLILLSVGCAIADSVETIHRDYGSWLEGVERMLVVAFTAEYAARLWACTVEPEFADPIRGRIAYALTPLSVIDLLAILPSFFAGALGERLIVLRLFRLLRILRAFKIAHYWPTLLLFGRVLRAKRGELTLALGLAALLVLVSSTLIYVSENESQPRAFSSIPASMWWAVITLTTVGYGDVVPHTTLGKLITAALSIIGVGFIALPAGILASGFLEEATRAKHSSGRCPACGRAGPDAP